MILADRLEELGDDVAAQRRRNLVARKRSLGCLWPRVSQISGLSDHQREVLARTLTRPFAVLCGTPGTGKTWCSAAIVRALYVAAHHVAVAAPTGKASVRITEALAKDGIHAIVTTIHSLLEIGRNGRDGEGWAFQRNASRPLEQRFVIIDEASMLDTDLAAALFSACRAGTHVLLVGDPYQLPPVGHGAPLRDLIASGTVPVGHLTEIRRNAGLIVRACAAIKDGRQFETVKEVSIQTFPERNLWHQEVATPEKQLEVLKTTLTWLHSQTSFHVVWQLQVLAAVNNKSPLSRRELNKILQQTLNVSPLGKDNPFMPGDKIICLHNHWAAAAYHSGRDYYIANGEIGRVLVAESTVTEAQFFDPIRHVRIPMAKCRAAQDDDERDDDPGTGCNFDLAYAVTGHKAQGSEWPCVILMIDSSPGARRVCSRNWIYTAISRASKLCITIGRMGVLQQMCRRPSLENRKTFLQELLTETKRIPS